MRILENVEIVDNYGNVTFETKERTVPDNVPAIRDIETTQPYVPLPTSEPTSGKLYKFHLNTTRDIKLDVPVNLTIGGYGVIIEKFFRPAPEYIKVVFSIQTGVSQKEAILRNLT